MDLDVLFPNKGPSAEPTLDRLECGIVAVMLGLVGLQIVRSVKHGHADIARITKGTGVDEGVLHHDVLLGKGLRTVLALEWPSNVQALSDRARILVRFGTGRCSGFLFYVMCGGVDTQLFRRSELHSTLETSKAEFRLLQTGRGRAVRLLRIRHHFIPINFRIEFLLLDLDLRLVHQSDVSFTINLSKEDPRTELASETTLHGGLVVRTFSLMVTLPMLLKVELPIETSVTVITLVRQLALMIENMHPNGLPRFERLRTEWTGHDRTYGMIPADVLFELSN